MVGFLPYTVQAGMSLLTLTVSALRSSLVENSVDRPDLHMRPKVLHVTDVLKREMLEIWVVIVV